MLDNNGQVKLTKVENENLNQLKLKTIAGWKPTTIVSQALTDG